MKVFRILFLFVVCAALTTGCKKGLDVDQLAKDTCNCTSEMMTLMDDIKAAAGDSLKLVTLNAKTADVASKGEECMKGLEKKYPGIDEMMKKDKALEEKAKAAMKKHCPAMAGMGN